MKIRNVLSTFDGCSCGQVALKRAGIEFDKYYASEIDKYPIKVTQHHFPDTIQLGDIQNWKDWNIDWGSIDLLLGGFCCQSFSFSGKQKGLNDPRGKLVLSLKEIYEHVKEHNPDVQILFENVKMKEEFKKELDALLGNECILIDSSLVSSQMRKRYYWTRTKITLPEDKGIKLQDIIEDTEEDKPGAIRGRYLNKATILGRRLNAEGKREDYNKNIPITQCLEVRATNRDKSNCLTTVAKDNVLTSMPVGRHPDAFKKKLPFRYYTTKELCRLQTLPDDYFEGLVSDSQAVKIIGNGWNVDTIVWILSEMYKEGDDK